MFFGFGQSPQDAQDPSLAPECPLLETWNFLSQLGLSDLCWSADRIGHSTPLQKPAHLFPSPAQSFLFLSKWVSWEFMYLPTNMWFLCSAADVFHCANASPLQSIQMLCWIFFQLRRNVHPCFQSKYGYFQAKPVSQAIPMWRKRTKTGFYNGNWLQTKLRRCYFPSIISTIIPRNWKIH